MKSREAIVVLVVVLVLRLAAVLAIDPAYGFHRDELLYLAMGDHFDLWRMQFPPVIALAARAGAAVFGDTNPLAARVPSALAATALTGVALLIVRTLRGGRTALALTAIALCTGIIYVRPGVLLHPVVFDQLWYALAAWGLLRASIDDDPRAGWMIVGLGLGLGGLTKFSVAFYALGFVVATLGTPRLRAQLRTRWPWLAVAVALLVALPAFVGQQLHGWPFLVQSRALRASQLQHVEYGAYLAGQPQMLGGAALLVVAVLVALVARRRSSAPPSDEVPGAAGAPAPVVQARAVLLAAATVVVTLLVLNGKAYYAGPVYVPIVALGAVLVERSARQRRLLAPTIAAVMVAIGVALLPAGVPVLAPAPMSRYAVALGLTDTNYGTQLTLPQDYADMTGWRVLATATADVWRGLPAEDRAEAAVFAVNYGRAGALQRFHRADGLPMPISLHGDFWAWGYGRATTRHLLVVGEGPDAVAPFCGAATLLRTVRNPLGVDEERDVPITFCRDLRLPLPRVWAMRGAQWG